MHRRVLFLLAACWASGCLLFPVLDGLTGGDAAPADAPFEAASDAGQGTDASIPDAPTDGATDADGEPFCAQHASATFCAAFDESDEAGAGFTSTYLTDGGVVALDTSAFVTAPASLLAGNHPLLLGESAHGALVESTNLTPSTSVTLDYDFRIDHLASQGTYIESLALVFQSPTRSSLQLNIKTASSDLGEELVGADGGKTYVAHLLPSALAQSAWMHLHLVVSVTSRTLHLDVDGNAVVDVSLNAAFANGTVDLYVGNAYAPGASDGAALHYDDVVLDVQ